jgi:hypothetical protein
MKAALSGLQTADEPHHFWWGLFFVVDFQFWLFAAEIC